ncbi:MAG: hypothetical protein FWG69_01835 [Oscillospiraceae bacterium]|nr:hypothetical protein [Oscillospiraceae bacterium]
MMSKVISVFSVTGGAGTSLTAAALALSFSSMGKSVVVAETGRLSQTGQAGFGRSQDLLLDADGVYNFGDLLEGKASPEQVAVKSRIPGDTDAGVRVLLSPAHGSVSGLINGAEHFNKILAQLSAKHDIILFDTAFEFIPFFLKQSDLGLLVTGVGLKEQRDCAGIGRNLNHNGKVRLILNNLDSKLPEGSIDLDETIDRIGIRLIGILPKQKSLLTLNGALKLEGSFKKAAGNICRRILGKQVPLLFK